MKKLLFGCAAIAALTSMIGCNKTEPAQEPVKAETPAEVKVAPEAHYAETLNAYAALINDTKDCAELAKKLDSFVTDNKAAIENDIKQIIERDNITADNFDSAKSIKDLSAALESIDGKITNHACDEDEATLAADANVEAMFTEPMIREIFGEDYLNKLNAEDAEDDAPEVAAVAEDAAPEADDAQAAE